MTGPRFHVTVNGTDLQSSQEITRPSFEDPLPRTSPTTPAPPHAGAGLHARLVVSRGADAGRAFDLTSPRVMLGRHHDSDIVIDDFTVSRHHAEIHRDDQGRYWILDGGSLNGVYVNRRPADTAELHDGDELWIGRMRFTFQLSTA